MALSRVDFICPRCQMFVKPDQSKVEVERTEDRVAYGHERCYSRLDGGTGSPQKED